jgi:HD superfamily phosphohydrolase
MIKVGGCISSNTTPNFDHSIPGLSRRLKCEIYDLIDYMFYLRAALIFLLFTLHLVSKPIETFYGTIEVNEPILLELIHCPAMQRLKNIHQYGVAYYTKTHPEEYTRFDHSLGVFAILKMKNASLEEQIAGLLHDVSHTAFSHVGDWVYTRENQEDDYQSSIHNLCLIRSGIEEILNRYGFEIDQISPKRKEFVMLEQPLPNLCADRIDYNIQGSYFQKFLTKDETKQLFSDLSFEEGKWVITNQELATKLANFSLFMTKDCWGSAQNFMTSKWLASAILKGLEIGLISWDEFHFGTDELIWEQLSQAEDPFIQSQMEMLHSPDLYYRLVDVEQANIFVPFRCRGIDPWIKQNGQTIRLTSINPLLDNALQKTKLLSLNGWPVEVLSP